MYVGNLAIFLKIDAVVLKMPAAALKLQFFLVNYSTLSAFAFGTTVASIVLSVFTTSLVITNNEPRVSSISSPWFALYFIFSISQAFTRILTVSLMFTIVSGHAVAVLLLDFLIRFYLVYESLCMGHLGQYTLSITCLDFFVVDN